MSKILVVAPHPDDETLGCGGTLLRHQNEGDEIHWLIMSVMNQELGFDQERIESRKREIKDVAKKYQFSSVHQAKFMATGLDMIPKSSLIMEVSTAISRVLPDTLYAPYRNDVHSDHQLVFDAVAACTKSFRYPSVKRVRLYETLSETEFGIRSDDSGFKPNLWIDISKYLNTKIEIMRFYKGEMAEHPFPRSEKNIRALSTLRGSTAGVEAAEAFISVKEII